MEDEGVIDRHVAVFVYGDVHVLREYVRTHALPDAKFAVRIECPHGAVVFYVTLDDIPDKDIPMPCGHENCWAIKYEAAQKEAA